MSEDSYTAIERRIEHLIIGVGFSTAVGALIGWGVKPCAGAAAGTGLCWLNFRWLRHRAAVLVRLGLTQAGLETIRAPKRIFIGSIARLGLMLIILYVILVPLRLPTIALICGLFAVIPAAVLEMLYEILLGVHTKTDAQ